MRSGVRASVSAGLLAMMPMVAMATGGGSDTQTAQIGACTVTMQFDDFMSSAGVSLSSGPHAGGSFFFGNISMPSTAITTPDLEACLGVGTVSGLSQSGASGSYGTDSDVGFSFTYASTVYEYRVVGTSSKSITNDGDITATPPADMTPPIFGNVQDQEFYTGDDSDVVSWNPATSGIDASDETDGVRPVTYEIGENAVTGSYSFPIGSTVVTAKASDESGNVGTTTFTVTVIDDGEPLITGTQTITANAGRDGTFVWGMSGSSIAAIDNVDGIIGVSFYIGENEVIGNYAFPIGTTTVTVIAVDAAGNAGSETFSVNVNATQLAYIIDPTDIIVDSAPGATSKSIDVTSHAEIGNEDEYSYLVYSVGDTTLTGAYDFPAGETTVVTVDLFGYVSRNADALQTKTFNVTVNAIAAPTDTTGPVIAAVADQTLTAAAGAPSVSFDVTTLGSATDDVDGTVSVTYLISEHEVTVPVTGPRDFSIGTTTVTMTAHDAAGNPAEEVTFDVIVAEGVVPVAAELTCVPGDTSGTGSLGINLDGAAADQFWRSIRVVHTSNIRLRYRVVDSRVVIDSILDVLNPQQEARIELTAIVNDTRTAFSCVFPVSVPSTPNVQRLPSVSEIIRIYQAQIITGASTEAANHLVRSLTSGLITMRLSFTAEATDDLGQYTLSTNPANPVWVTSAGNWATDDGLTNSSYYTVIGAHAPLTQVVTVGGMLMLDSVTSSDDDYTSTNRGYLVGPYFVAQLPEQPLVFEAHILGGHGANEITFDGFAPIDYASDRSLAAVSVTGVLEYGATKVTPHLNLTRVTDASDAFEIASGTVEAQSLISTDLSAGVEVSHPYALERGTVLVTGGLIGSASSNRMTTGSEVETTETARARASLSAEYTMQSGVVVDGGLTYDGIGDDSYESIGVSFGAKMKF